MAFHSSHSDFKPTNINVVSYNATTPTTTADRTTQTQPVAILDLISQAILHDSARKEPERFDALERAGFKLDRWGSIQKYLYARGGGHYVDVGGSDMISKGMVSRSIQCPFYLFTNQSNKLLTICADRSKSNPTLFLLVMSKTALLSATGHSSKQT